MILSVNAASLRSGGGRSVALNFLNSIKNRKDIEVHAFIPSECGYKNSIGNAKLKLHPIPSYLDKRMLRPVVEQVWIPKKAVSIGSDVLFSMSNIASQTKLSQAVLFHWPYAIYPNSPVWDRMSIYESTKKNMKIGYFKKMIDQTDLIISQTDTAKKRLDNLYSPSAKVKVFPNAVSVGSQLRDFVSNEFSSFRSEKKYVFLCLSRYYTHKNIEVLTEVAKLIRQKNLSIGIVTTVSEKSCRGSKKYIESIEEEELGEILLNIGPVPRGEIKSLYDKVDALVLPTLLESYSGTYIEAMEYGIPVVTSNLDFAQGVCGDAAFYFDPTDPRSILSKMIESYQNSKKRSENIRRGREKAKSNPEWPELAGKIISELKKMS